MPEFAIDEICNAVAPLYVRFNDASPPQAAFLQLNPANGDLSFGVRLDHLITDAEKNRTLFCWPVSPKIRGRHCLAVAEALVALSEIVRDGYSEELDDSLSFVGVLDDQAQEAIEQIANLLEVHLIDPSNPDHVATVYYPEDFIQDRIAEPSEVAAETTDEQLEQIAREYLEIANDEGIFIDGRLIDALVQIRNEARESAVSL